MRRVNRRCLAQKASGLDFTSLLSEEAPADMPLVTRKMVRATLEEMGEDCDGGCGVRV